MWSKNTHKHFRQRLRSDWLSSNRKEERGRGSYAGHVLFVRVVKDVDFLLEGVEDLAMAGHVSGEDQRDGPLGDGNV